MAATLNSCTQPLTACCRNKICKRAARAGRWQRKRHQPARPPARPPARTHRNERAKQLASKAREAVDVGARAAGCCEQEHHSRPGARPAAPCQKEVGAQACWGAARCWSWTPRSARHPYCNQRHPQPRTVLVLGKLEHVRVDEDDRLGDAYNQQRLPPHHSLHHACCCGGRQHCSREASHVWQVPCSQNAIITAPPLCRTLHRRQRALRLGEQLLPKRQRRHGRGSGNVCSCRQHPGRQGAWVSAVAVAAAPPARTLAPPPPVARGTSAFPGAGSSHRGSAAGAHTRPPPPRAASTPTTARAQDPSPPRPTRGGVQTAPAIAAR